MISNAIKHINPARRSGLAMMAARWRILLLSILTY